MIGETAARAPALETPRPRAVGSVPAQLLNASLLTAALACWVVALFQLDPDAIGDLGLLSAMPPVMYVAFGLLTCSFVVALLRHARAPMLTGHVVALVALIHATAPITYGTLRYAWSWKHVGVVEYIARQDALWPQSPTLTVYHNWPGFFSGSTALTEAGGLDDAITLASWAPAFFQLLFVLAAMSIYWALTNDRRVVALGAWIFVAANWVGQDYFAPQAFAYFLHLAVLAVVLRWLQAPPRVPRPFRWLVARIGRNPSEREPLQPVPDPLLSRSALVIAVALMAIIAMSHPLTPFVLIASLVGLALVGTLTVRALPLVMIVLTAGWLLTGAWPYFGAEADDIVREIGRINRNVGANLHDLGQASAEQQLVSTLGRSLVVFVLLLALVGFIRRLRAGRVELAPAVLLAAPALFAVVGSYGGEILFRIFLFSLPFAAYLAARAFLAVDGRGGGWRLGAAVVCVTALLLPAFLFAHFGKEQWFRFTQSEVNAAQAVFENAPRNSLLISATSAYPIQFEHYERFSYVSIMDEPRGGIRRMLADPVEVLEDWMSDMRFARTYLLITRSQREETDSLGLLPRGALAEVERRMLASGRFEVLYHDRDATLLARTPAASETDTPDAPPGVA